jgi:DNA-binding MarR family transcriptional regulator
MSEPDHDASLEYPQSDDREIGYRVAKATLGSIPTVGAGLQEILSFVVESPLEKRRNQWCNNVSAALQGLQHSRRDIDFKKLSADEEFISILSRCTIIALSTHSREKIEALKNAVLNTAAGARLDEVLQSKFLSLLSSYSALHFKILEYYDLPLEHPEMTERVMKRIQPQEPCSLRDIFSPLFPDINPAVLDEIERDLLQDQLIVSGISRVATSRGPIPSFTTVRGKALMQFIRVPAQ